jgi:hypothetical protein
MRIHARVVGAALAVITALSLATSAPSRADSSENQVRAVLDGMNGSYNRKDFAGFASHLCASMMQTAGFAANWYASRGSDGPTRITVNSVDVNGDDAVANVRFDAANHEDSKTLDIEFVREGVDWKACQYRAGQTV